MFSDDTFEFLKNLAKHNEREWFDAHKSDYERDVREPALEFIEAMAPAMQKISPHFPAVAKKVGGSMMRPYRDTRFSHDKTPYKTNIGIQFRHDGGKDVHAPGYYIHIALDECFVGVGLWRPPTPVLTQIRQAIDSDPKGWQKAKKALFQHYQPHADDSLKRAPKGFAEEHPFIDDLKLKSHLGTVKLTKKDVVSRAFIDEVERYFNEATLYMRFLCQAVGVAF